MIDEHREMQNSSSNSLTKCSAALTGQSEANRDSKNECTDDSDVPQGPNNDFDQFLVNPDVEGVKDIVRTIENAVFRIIDNNFDHLANHSSNTLGMRVKDSLILKVKQTDKKEVPLDELKTPLACRLIVDDDLQLRLLPQTGSLAPGSDSEDLSTKRKKSVSLDEEVKIFKEIENEFFAENHSDKIMDRGKSTTGMSEEEMPDCSPHRSIIPASSETSFLNYLNTKVVSQDQEIEMKETRSKDSQKSGSPKNAKELIKEFDNAVGNPTILSFSQLIANYDEELQETQRVDETIGISKNDQDTIDALDTDEDYGRKKLSKADKNAGENMSDENDKIKQIRKLMNEFLSSLKKPSEDKNKAEDQTPKFNDAKQESTTAILGQSQPDLVINKTSEDEISKKVTPGVNNTDQEMSNDEDTPRHTQDVDSYVEGNNFQMNQGVKDGCNISYTEENVEPEHDDAMIEESHSESSKIDDQLLADFHPREVRSNSGIDVKDITVTSDTSETDEDEINNGMKFRNGEELAELEMSKKEMVMKSTFDTKMMSSTNDPLATETLTKVSLKADNLSKQSWRTDSGTDHQSPNDISLEQTSSTISREGSKSSGKSSRMDITDIISPGPNNITVKTFPVFAKDKDVLKHTESIHVREPELSVTLKAEKSPINLKDDKYEGEEGNDPENGTGASAVIHVLRHSFNLEEPLEESRKDIKSKEELTINVEEAFPNKSESIQSQETSQYYSESRINKTTTRNYSPVIFDETESAVVADLASPSAVEDQSEGQPSIEEKVEPDSTVLENERDKEDSSDSVTPDKYEPLNSLSNLKSIFKSLNKSQSEKRSIASIGDLENTDTVEKSFEIEVDETDIQLIQSTKSLRDDRKRMTGHKLFDDPPDTEKFVPRSCQATTHNDFEDMENMIKPEYVGVANGEANYSEASVVKSNAQKLLTNEEKVNEEAAEVFDNRVKCRKDRKSEESARKFAISLSRIFSNSSRKRNDAKESKGTLDAEKSAEGHSEIPKITLSYSDDSDIQYNGCEIRNKKSDVTEDNREELVAIRSLDSMQDSFTTYKSIVKSSSKYSTKVSGTQLDVNQTLSQNEIADKHSPKDAKEIRKYSETIYATKGTVVSYAQMVESAKHISAEDRDDRSIDDPVEKRQKKSAGKSFAGIRKLFSGASMRYKKDRVATENHVDRKPNQDSTISANISSVASANENQDEGGGRESHGRIEKEPTKSEVKIERPNLAHEVLVGNLVMQSNVVINKVEVNHSGFKSMENVKRDQIVIRSEKQMDMNKVFDVESIVSQRSNDTKRSSLLSMAKSYIRRRSEIEAEGTEAITVSTEDRTKVLKDQGVAKTQSMFSRGMRKLFKKRNSVVDTVSSNDYSASDSTDNLSHFPDIQNFAKPTKNCSNHIMMGTKSCESRNGKVEEKFDVKQLVYSATAVPSWNDLEINKSKSTVPLLRSMEKESDRLPKVRSKSHNRSTISDDDYADTETSSNMRIPERYTEIRFMEHDEPGKPTESNEDDKIGQKQRWSEITSNDDVRPIRSFAGRRSTIVMMASPMPPRDEGRPENSGSSNESRDESSSSPTAFYYLLGPSLDEALIDVRVMFQNLIDKIIGRSR